MMLPTEIFDVSATSPAFSGAWSTMTGGPFFFFLGCCRLRLGPEVPLPVGFGFGLGAAGFGLGFGFGLGAAGFGFALGLGFGSTTTVFFESNFFLGTVPLDGRASFCSFFFRLSLRTTCSAVTPLLRNFSPASEVVFVVLFRRLALLPADDFAPRVLHEHGLGEAPARFLDLALPHTLSFVLRHLLQFLLF